MVRSYGTILLDAQVNQPSQVNNDVTEYKIDVDHYNKTGEIKKIGAEEVVPTIDQLTAGKKLREEIKTIEDFVKVGTYQEVAKQYGVSVATAHGLMMHLKAMEGVEPEPKPKTKAQIMREEVTTLEQFEALGSYKDVAKKYGVGKTAANDWQNKLREDAGTMEQSKDENTSTEGQEPYLEQGNGDSSISLPKEDSAGSESVISGTDKPACFGVPIYENPPCTKSNCDMEDQCYWTRVRSAEETVDDLQGLVEPEPPWNTQNYGGVMGVTRNPEITKTMIKGYERYLDRVAKELEKPVTDEDIIQSIKADIQELRERRIKRMDEELIRELFN